MMERFTLAVVGAGASGLMAACTAAEILGPGKVALLDGNAKPGKKLLATGNGRCNLTNLHVAPGHYHGDVALAAPLFSAYPPGRVLGEFASLGLLTRADDEGRVYPSSLQAASVLQMLWGTCEERGVALRAGSLVERAELRQGGFLLEAGGPVWAEKLLLACGGMASPRHGGGGGYGLAKSLGHSVTPLRPGLTPLRCPQKLTAPLKGMRARARASLWQKGRELCADGGEVIFGEGTLSGIVIFDLSLYLEGPGEVVLDLAEDMEREKLTAYFCQLQKRRPQLPVREIFSGLVNLRVGQQRAKTLGFLGDAPLSSLGQKELSRAAQGLKEWRFPVEPMEDWENAQITAGGVPLMEIDIRTMESKRQKGLFLAGEMLNIHGGCGGYNLHWAWATGLQAGRSACGMP